MYMLHFSALHMSRYWLEGVAGMTFFFCWGDGEMLPSVRSCSWRSRSPPFSVCAYAKHVNCPSCSGASRLLSIVIINNQSCDATMWKPQVAIRAWAPLLKKLLLRRQLEFYHSIWSAWIRQCVSVCAYVWRVCDVCVCVHASIVSHQLQCCLSLHWSDLSMPCFAALSCLSPSNLRICTFHKINDIDKVTITVIIYCRLSLGRVTAIPGGWIEELG